MVRDCVKREGRLRRGKQCVFGQRYGLLKSKFNLLTPADTDVTLMIWAWGYEPWVYKSDDGNDALRNRGRGFPLKASARFDGFPIFSISNGANNAASLPPKEHGDSLLRHLCVQINCHRRGAEPFG
jgi:hypothetical protein